MKIRKGDTVEVIAGKNKGQRGEVIRVFKEKNRVVVQGVNVRTKHQKQQQTRGQRPIEAGKIEFEAPINASNVMVVDPSDSTKLTRVGYRVEDGKKIRVARNSGADLD